MIRTIPRTSLRRLRLMGASLAAMSGVTAAVGCDGTGRQFRQAALPGIESGVDAFVNGVLDGIFASIEVESGTDADDSSGT